MTTLPDSPSPQQAASLRNDHGDEKAHPLMRRSTHYPEAVWRTGTVHMTIVEAHPYHRPVSTVDRQGAGAYVVAFEPNCPLCREQRRIRGGPV